MIRVTNDNFNLSEFMNQYEEGSIERTMLDKMSASAKEYQYDVVNTLIFELNLRRQIVKSAIDLNASRLGFSVFEKSRCNPQYWYRTSNGGFMLKEGAKPSSAINDIYVNGNKYATECATAIMIVYYKALLNVFKEDLFNKTFTTIYLMDWDVREPLLKEVTDLKQSADALLGDRQYFANPDFDRQTPEWQGENVIVLPNNMYYGHGIGIATGEDIIRTLNTKRRSEDSRSAYLMDVVSYPDFRKLANVYSKSTRQTSALVWKPFPEPIIQL